MAEEQRLQLPSPLILVTSVSYRLVWDLKSDISSPMSALTMVDRIASVGFMTVRVTIALECCLFFLLGSKNIALTVPGFFTKEAN